MNAPVASDRAAGAAGRAAGGGALLPVAGADLTVPLVTGGAVRYVNLDYAATAPALESVAERVRESLAHYSSVHRGAGWPSVVSTALYEQAREAVAGFVGARPSDVVVFTRNTTDALNLLASAVPDGCRVIHLDAEHHGNLLPWRGRGHLAVPVAGTVAQTLSALESALAAARSAAPTGARRAPALVSITGASNVTGEMPPLADIVALARAYRARIAVDGAQLVPHRRVDMAAQDIDYLAFSGHKLYAPFGAGALIGRRDWLDAAPPYLRGGGAVHEVNRAEVEWAASPARHEAGTPNLLGAIAVAAACDALAELPVDALPGHEQALLDRLDAGLADLAGPAGLRPLRIWPQDAVDRVAVRAFTVAGREPARVAAWLSAEHGIGVRHGRFCAHQLVSALVPQSPDDVEAPQALRVSMGVGSTADDVDRVLAALRQLAENGEAWHYSRQDGQWTPVPDPRSWGPAGAGRNLSSPCGT